MNSQTYCKMCRPVFAISDAEWNLDSYTEKHTAMLNIGVKRQVKKPQKTNKTKKDKTRLASTTCKIF